MVDINYRSLIYHKITSHVSLPEGKLHWFLGKRPRLWSFDFPIGRPVRATCQCPSPLEEPSSELEDHPPIKVGPLTMIPTKIYLLEKYIYLYIYMNYIIHIS